MPNNSGVRLELVPVNKTHDRHVVFDARADRDDRVVVIDDFFEGRDAQWRLSDLVNLFFLFVARLFLIVQDLALADVLLLRDELLLSRAYLFHQQVVFHAVHLERFQPALRHRGDVRKLDRGLNAFFLLPLVEVGRRVGPPPRWVMGGYAAVASAAFRAVLLLLLAGCFPWKDNRD